MVPSVVAYGVVTLLAAFIAAFAGLPSFFSPPFEGRGIISITIGVALATIIVRGGRLLERYEWYARMGAVLREPVRLLLGPRAGAQEAFLVALSSGMGEEAVFRGLCQPGLVQLFVRHTSLQGRPAILVAIVATAISFTLLHPPWKRELRPWTFFALVMGLAWGALAAWSGSLAASVLSHFLVNFFNLRRLLEWEPDEE